MKYLLNRDDDGHWFVIPADKEPEWRKYLDLVYGQEQYDTDPPEWAVEVGGAPNLVQFENWEIV